MLRNIILATFLFTSPAFAQPFNPGVPVSGTPANNDCAKFVVSGGNVQSITTTGAPCDSALPVGANPTATAGPAAVNGVATTFMRSDAAPAVQKASAVQFGISECDNTTITCAGGVFVSVGPVASVFGRTGAVVAATNDYGIAQINNIGAGCSTWLTTPNSANLATCVTDESGTGPLVFANNPTLDSPIFTTKATSPFLYGGAVPGSSLTLASTSGVGNTDYLNFLTGNNLEAGRIITGGQWIVGPYASAVTSNYVGIFNVITQATQTVVAMDSYGQSNIGTFVFRAAGGTVSPYAPSNLTTGTVIGQFGGRVYTNNAWSASTGGRIYFTYTDTSPGLGQSISFDTTPNGGARALAMLINQSGGVQIGSTAIALAASEFGLSKISASGSAPGAGTAKIAWVAGTNANTCKLISYAGTSITPVTIVDNVGGGC